MSDLISRQAALDAMETWDKMKFTIFDRQTNSTNTADGYTEWQEVDEWDAEDVETTIDQWMDNMRYVDDRFVQTGASSYRLDDIEFDVKAENN